MNLKHTTSLLALLACLSGCALGPDYQRPEIALTAQYQTALPEEARGQTAALDEWWRGFDDPALQRLVARALAQNLDLEQARARVQQSHAVAQAAGAALLPRGDAAAGAADVRQSLLSPLGAVARGLPGFERRYDDYSVGASASWELDLFGGLRRTREAASADEAAMRALAQGTRLSIAADAADAYLRMRELQARLDVASHQEGVQRDLLDLVARRNREGLSSDRDLYLSRAALAGVQASLPPLRARLEAQWNRLDVLMGAQPGTYRSEFQAEAPIPDAPSLAAHQAPADLLRRRPDVLAAEQRLVAANARIGASLSDYYPKVSLSALLGFESVLWSQLSSGNAVERGLVVGTRWRLFDFGRVDAEVAQARGREAEALAAYRATVLRAAEDVEDALAELAQDKARVSALDDEVDKLTHARRLAQMSFEGGVITLLDVRDTDRELLAASDQLAQARAEIALNTVRLFRALGGGWQAEGT